MTTGERIRSARTNAGLSQTELANRLRISKQLMYKYENDVIKNIPMDTLKEIAQILDVSPSYLADFDDASNQSKDKVTVFDSCISETALLVAKAYDNADPSVQFSVCKMLDIPVTLDVAARDGQGGQVTLTIKQVDEGKKIRQRLLDEGADQSDL